MVSGGAPPAARQALSAVAFAPLGEQQAGCFWKSLRADLCLNVEVLQMTLAQRLSVGEIRKSQLEVRDRAFAIVKPLL